MEYTADMLKDLLRLPEGQVFSADEDLSRFYRQWGFTIYRTAYGETTNDLWDSLSQDIRSRVRDQILGSDTAGDNAEAQRLWSLFVLDVRDDPGNLSGATMDQVRLAFREEVGGRPMNVDDGPRRIFLYVDEEVMEFVGRGELMVKCVQADYRAEDYVPRNPRLGGQRFFGWMKATTKSLLSLWYTLSMRNFDEIAPETIGGAHLVIWDGDNLI
ncbi:hypothetical protein BU24DRAFT_453173 [Aaosphaeria arxii CBS 175.79]|uniref:Uncharacterized protein n=1 Tax=Aaosphaeria arxii CBS 175.79 TaxID=1450172 RepID=A0A6A5XIA7_9PLEO|nr:uncharacterized protein BU24DRAFT_453173 [Aaosphaeria arxii CBS 175.79]KAF2012852.1 hypothetical protein BU24DRAFT_453173 [Aaosphaeria arxii CBS 175.79]